MITIYDIKFIQHFTAKFIANLIINNLINKVVQCNGKDKTKKLSSFTPIAVYMGLFYFQKIAWFLEIKNAMIHSSVNINRDKKSINQQ